MENPLIVVIVLSLFVLGLIITILLFRYFRYKTIGIEAFDREEREAEEYRQGIDASELPAVTIFTQVVDLGNEISQM